MFGSAVSRWPEVGNDIDLIMDMGEGKNIPDWIALKQDLGGLLGSPVDLVTDKVLAEAISQ